MIQIRKTGITDPLSATSEPLKRKQLEKDRELFTLPKESGLGKPHDDIDRNLVIMKTALRDLGSIPKSKRENKLIIRFYAALIQYLK